MFESDANGTIDFNQFTKIASGDFDCDMKLFAKNLFKDLDADKDGFISFDEFQNAKNLLVDLPILPSELKEAFDKADTDKDGKLSLQGKSLSSKVVVKTIKIFCVKFIIFGENSNSNNKR